MAQRGGKRPGAGRKPGSRNKLTEENKASIIQLAKSMSEVAMRTLREVCENRKAPAAARVSAANSILDRAYGKPIALVQSDDDAPVSLSINITAAPAVGDVRVTRSDG